MIQKSPIKITDQYQVPESYTKLPVLSPNRNQLRYNTRPKKHFEEGELDSRVKLVPSRWSNSGWKYVMEDPMNQSFFNHPNRVNAHGWQKGSRFAAKNGAKSVMRSHVPRESYFASHQDTERHQQNQS
mmetsp:Transcript_39536/g.60374  ORF Transcript_39536/g.60374 Transcript_39536/m.60374 type:complete len:128 (+) Transcript_39536:3-386(+)